MSRSTRAALRRGAMCHGGILPETPVGTHLNPAPYISKFTSRKRTQNWSRNASLTTQTVVKCEGKTELWTTSHRCNPCFPAVCMTLITPVDSVLHRVQGWNRKIGKQEKRAGTDECRQEDSAGRDSSRKTGGCVLSEKLDRETREGREHQSEGNEKKKELKGQEELFLVCRVLKGAFICPHIHTLCLETPLQPPPQPPTYTHMMSEASFDSNHQSTYWHHTNRFHVFCCWRGTA